MANGILTFSMLDHSDERSSVTIQTGAVTAVSLPGLLTQVGTLRDAISAITLGTMSGEALKVFDTTLSNARPASELARRETKWLVRYEDNLPFFDDPVNAIPNEGFGKVFTVTIPTADLAGRVIPGTDMADVTNQEIADFIDAFEATARSPYGGTVNVLSLTAVGRNL